MRTVRVQAPHPFLERENATCTEIQVDAHSGYTVEASETYSMDQEASATQSVDAGVQVGMDTSGLGAQYGVTLTRGISLSNAYSYSDVIGFQKNAGSLDSITVPKQSLLQCYAFVRVATRRVEIASWDIVRPLVRVDCGGDLQFLVTEKCGYRQGAGQARVIVTPDAIRYEIHQIGECGSGGGDDDGDGKPDWEDDDMDGDGITNENDDDIDGDGEPNETDPDDDNDGIDDGSDPEPGGREGSDDIDDDGVDDENDNDVDGDGILNGEDGDVDGDGIPNEEDGDIDGDGVINEEDSDIDGDGIPNETDLTPYGKNGALNLPFLWELVRRFMLQRLDP